MQALLPRPAPQRQRGRPQSQLRLQNRLPHRSMQLPGLDALDTSGKQLLAFFDKDLLARGHAAMTTAAHEGTLLIPSGLRGLQSHAGTSLCLIELLIASIELLIAYRSS